MPFGNHILTMLFYQTTKSKPKPQVKSPQVSTVVKGISKSTVKKPASRIPNLIKGVSSRIPLSPKKSFSPVVKPFLNHNKSRKESEEVDDDNTRESEGSHVKVVVTTAALMRFKYKG